MLQLTTRNYLYKAGVLLLILAFSDAIFTDSGIRQNAIQEANPLMRLVYEGNILGFYVIKISLPLLLLVVLTKIEPKPYLSMLLGSTLLLYAFVLFLHAFWIVSESIS